MSQARQNDLFQALLRISAVMQGESQLQPVLEKILDIAMEVTEAERGFILLKSLLEDDQLIPAIYRNLDPENFLDHEHYSRGVVEQVMESGEPVVTINATEDERFKGRESIVVDQLNSIFCVPIHHGDQTMGYIYLDSHKKRTHFNLETLEFLKVFATQTALAILNTDYIGKLSREIQALKTHTDYEYPFNDIIGDSPEIQKVLRLTEKVIPTDVPVLILGDSGTGKELIAKAIHYQGHRKDKAFVAQYCGALADNLLESELFGYKKGAFTGATKDKPGLIEVADGGTFFLDEIADVSLTIQTKLLRFVQEGEYRRVGDTHLRKSNVRLLAATNKNLEEMVKKGSFREDLYYRLNVVTIQMPALAKRKQDIQPLAEYFLEKYSNRYHKPIRGFASQALEMMKHHTWPGNIRELQNAVQRGVTLCSGGLIGPDHLGLLGPDPDGIEPVTLSEMERQFVIQTLQSTQGNRTKAAERLGVSLRWLQYRLKDWNLED